MAAIGYEADGDMANPSGSVFCAHGAGFLVDWDQVPEYMHLESCLETQKDRADGIAGRPELPTEKSADRRTGRWAGEDREAWIGTEEVDASLERTFLRQPAGNSAGTKSGWKTGRNLTVFPW